MTAPVPHGYPDWGRFVAQADVVILNQAVPDIDAQTIYGPFFVGGIAYIHLRVFGVVGGLDVNIEYHNDSLGTTLLSAQDFQFTSGTTLNVVIPTLGPWLRFRVLPFAANGQFTIQVHSVAAPGIPMFNDSRANALISASNVAVGAGATVVQGTTRIWPGQAYWSVATALATWFAELRTVNFAGGTALVDIVSQRSPDPSRAVFLPCQAAEITFTNQTGAAGTFWAFLTGRPIWPGG